MSILLDTNAPSGLLHAQPDSAVRAWVAAQPANAPMMGASC